jgi:hypothetical protein
MLKQLFIAPALTFPDYHHTDKRSNRSIGSSVLPVEQYAEYHPVYRIDCIMAKLIVP